jgi:transaldolase
VTQLRSLYEHQGQSPWIDNITRPMLDGPLQALVEAGVRGVPSNPTIFQKAISAGTTYDEQFTSLMEAFSVEDAYWGMVLSDISQALDVLAPVHEESDGEDGFVSLEVSPAIAEDTEATISAARWLHERVNRSNLLVKIPATPEGIPAIRQMIAEGRRINVTLIFGLERYAEVIEAYLDGLEALASSGPSAAPDGQRRAATERRGVADVNSVASFFVSRVDTEVDRRLEVLASSVGEDQPLAREALTLRGRAGVAQLAYQLFLERFSGPRWAALEAQGARVQRPLWASTSTKNPAYPDLLYVDNLIGPRTVNTMPDATLQAFVDHGTVARTIDAGVDDARRTMERLAEVGIDMSEVSTVLEQQGVAAFLKSFDELIQALTAKANALAASA